MAMAPLSNRQGNERGTRSRQRCRQLLPEIPDDITLREICPKLPWKDFHILSAVSQAWHHAIRMAIRSREVHDARVLSHSTEEFVIVDLDFRKHRIGLLSTRDNYLIKLPRIGHRRQDLVTFDGCIYLLGQDVNDWDTQEDLPIIGDEVFVLDVAAGERRWRKCASMKEENCDFEAAVIDGNIYVCGGYRIGRDGLLDSCGSKVYNPKKDLWSPVKPIPGSGTEDNYIDDYRTEAVGEELFVWACNEFENDLVLNIYHPGKDEWRVVSPRKRTEVELMGRKNFLFVAREKLHLLHKYGVDIYNTEENSWTELHTFSFLFLKPDWFTDARATVVHLEDELLIRSRVRRRDRNRFTKEKLCLAKSIGFGGENKEIVWQKVLLTHSQKKLLKYTSELTTILL